MPALVNSSVGSPCGTSEEEGTILWPRAWKYSRKRRRISEPVSILISYPAGIMAVRTSMADKVGVHRVAALAKVSIGTVDRALHGRAGINPDTRERVLRVARELGYEPNLAARALSKRRAHI